MGETSGRLGGGSGGDAHVLLWQSHPDHFPARSTEVDGRMRKMIGATRGRSSGARVVFAESMGETSGRLGGGSGGEAHVLLWQSHPDHFPARSTEVDGRMRKMIGATRVRMIWPDVGVSIPSKHARNSRNVTGAELSCPLCPNLGGRSRLRGLNSRGYACYRMLAVFRWVQGRRSPRTLSPVRADF